METLSTNRLKFLSEVFMNTHFKKQLFRLKRFGSIILNAGEMIAHILFT